MYTVLALSIHPSLSILLSETNIFLVEILLTVKFSVFNLKNEQYWILAILKNYYKKNLYCLWYIILARSKILLIIPKLVSR